MLSDSHAHLDDERFEGERDEVIGRAKEADIQFILNPGVEEKTSLQAIALSEAYDIVYAGVGFHPSDCTTFDFNKHPKMIEQWCEHPKVLAIGEIGLDYYYEDGAPRAVQKKVFEAQMAFANTHKKPIIVHDRDAHGDSLEMVRSCLNPNIGGVFHSFSGSVEMAKLLLDFGFYLSIGGPLTFKNSRKSPDVIAYMPLDRLLIETDSPYLTPVPHRGKRNEPAYVKYVAEKVAEIKDVSLDAVMETTFGNCKRLFKF